MKLIYLLFAVTIWATGDKVSADCNLNDCQMTGDQFDRDVGKNAIDCLRRLRPTCSEDFQSAVDFQITAIEQQVGITKGGYADGAYGLTSSLSVCLVLSAIAYFLSVFKGNN